MCACPCAPGWSIHEGLRWLSCGRSGRSPTCRVRGAPLQTTTLEGCVAYSRSTAFAAGGGGTDALPSKRLSRVTAVAMAEPHDVRAVLASLDMSAERTARHEVVVCECVAHDSPPSVRAVWWWARLSIRSVVVMSKLLMRMLRSQDTIAVRNCSSSLTPLSAAGPGSPLQT